MANGSSSKLRRIYDSLPPEAQKDFVDNHLTELLGLVPKAKANRVVSAATRLQKQYNAIPSVDLRGKKKEIRSLLNDLRRDSKRAFLKERSNRVEIFSEIIETLTSWMAQIWRVVYEHKVHFAQAHAALLYIWEVILELNDNSGPGGCKCSVTNLPVTFNIKLSSGRVVKHFSHANLKNVDGILLWIWREVFLSMSAVVGRQARKKIPEMLMDIEDNLGWKSLANLLSGGCKPVSSDEEEDEFLWQSVDENSDEDELEDELEEVSSFSSTGDEDEQGYRRGRCSCKLHARHWSSEINKQRLLLRGLVVERLRNLFEVEPSLPLYAAIIDLNHDDDSSAENLMEMLSRIATNCSSTYAAALAIYASEADSPKIIQLLDGYSYLLRPQDTVHYQAAVFTLAEEDEPQYRTRAIKIIETELYETIKSIRLCVQSCFRGITNEIHKAELRRILKLQMASQSRIDRLSTWVDAIITPSSNPLNPVTFAAMMMGFPTGALDDGDDGGALGILDMDPDDPDLEDLREEYRPRLRERFDGWVDIALTTKGGATVLSKLYVKMAEEMPFLTATDVADAMISRLADRPTKDHVMEALDSMASFAKLQRKKRATRQKKREAAKNSGTAASAPQPSSSSGLSQPSPGVGSNTPAFSFSFGEIFGAPAPAPLYGGLDDVD
ncbi:hypothetical protein BDP27DRAFT_1316635 [Rhodocollybia butyracea]|uniref:Uncharacterized protein n=1 Tax=Rhodocollybia butyracea TaxID=206335 RepID=A0A9P5UD01_9AGAR|nr:hypothetical protein BDP27DRAFT_1316635 [Rhodocollybia butyracea]